MSIAASLATAAAATPYGARRRQPRAHASRSRVVTAADSTPSPSSSPPTSLIDAAALRDAKLIYATAPAMLHMREGHPESNARVPAILDALALGGLTPAERPGELVFLAGTDTLTLVHFFSPSC